MNLIDEISEKEIETIGKYIDAYAIPNGYKREADIKYILREWADKKRTLYEIFGNHLILSKEIVYSESVEEISTKIMNKFYDGAAETFLNAYRNMFVKWGAPHRFCEAYWLIDTKELATNSWGNYEFTIEFPDVEEFKPIRVSKGMKITKILGKLAKAFDLPGYEEFRLAHSMCLNQKMLRGKLCLSIHPLDYMTMSDNESGWSSCMSWIEEGCYRQGTVEMMNSPIVVVAYLASDDKDMDLWEMPWNNKKWRQLFIVNPAIITNIKAYPYKNDMLTDICLDWLKELVDNTNAWYEYDDKITIYEAYEMFKHNGKNLKIVPHTHYMYNDFYKDQRAYIKRNISDGYIELDYSGKPECMVCGNVDISVDSEGLLACYDCYDIERWFCEDCGEELGEDEIWEINGHIYCEDCYFDNTRVAYDTGERHFKDDLYDALFYRWEKDSYGDSIRVEVGYVYTTDPKIITKAKDKFGYCMIEKLDEDEAEDLIYYMKNYDYNY